MEGKGGLFVEARTAEPRLISTVFKKKSATETKRNVSFFQAVLTIPADNSLPGQLEGL
jgi:hypothetical protein